MNRAGQRLFAIGLSMLLAGCATFEHQTTEMEPHAVITVVKPWEVAVGERVVKSLDGLPVSGGKSYRVRPGGHAVVVEFTELISETAKPKTVVLWERRCPSRRQTFDVGRRADLGYRAASFPKHANGQRHPRGASPAVVDQLDHGAGGRQLPTVWRRIYESTVVRRERGHLAAMSQELNAGLRRARDCLSLSSHAMALESLRNRA